MNITYRSDTFTKWYDNQSSILANYNPNILSRFNITWNSSDESVANVSTVYIEGNWSGTPTNYTINNNTYGGDIFNYSAKLLMLLNMLINNLIE